LEWFSWLSCADAQNLASNREDWLRWLGDTGGDAGHDHVDRDGQQSGEDRGEGVLGTTVLWHLDQLLDDPTDQVHPAHRRREAEARNDGVEGLGFQFLGNEVDRLEGLSSHVSHGESFILLTQKILFWEKLLPLDNLFIFLFPDN